MTNKTCKEVLFMSIKYLAIYVYPYIFLISSFKIFLSMKKTHFQKHSLGNYANELVKFSGILFAFKPSWHKDQNYTQGFCSIWISKFKTFLRLLKTNKFNTYSGIHFFFFNAIQSNLMCQCWSIIADADHQCWANTMCQLEPMWYAYMPGNTSRYLLMPVFY